MHRILESEAWRRAIKKKKPRTCALQVPKVVLQIIAHPEEPELSPYELCWEAFQLFKPIFFCVQPPCSAPGVVLFWGRYSTAEGSCVLHDDDLMAFIAILLKGSSQWLLLDEIFFSTLFSSVKARPCLLLLSCDWEDVRPAKCVMSRMIYSCTLQDQYNLSAPPRRPPDL